MDSVLEVDGGFAPRRLGEGVGSGAQQGLKPLSFSNSGFPWTAEEMGPRVTRQRFPQGRALQLGRASLFLSPLFGAVS